MKESYNLNLGPLENRKRFKEDHKFNDYDSIKDHESKLDLDPPEASINLSKKNQLNEENESMNMDDPNNFQYIPKHLDQYEDNIEKYSPQGLNKLFDIDNNPVGNESDLVNKNLLELQGTSASPGVNLDLQLYYELCKKLFLIESGIIYLKTVDNNSALEKLKTQKNYLLVCVKMVKKGYEIDSSKIHPELNPYILFDMDENTRMEEITLIFKYINEKIDFLQMVQSETQDILRTQSNTSDISDSFAQICEDLKVITNQKEQMKNVLKNPWIPLPKYQIIPYTYYASNSLISLGQNSLKIQYIPDFSMQEKSNYIIVISIEDENSLLASFEFPGEIITEKILKFNENFENILGSAKLTIRAIAKCFIGQKLKYINEIDLRILLTQQRISYNCKNDNQRRSFNITVEMCSQNSENVAKSYKDLINLSNIVTPFPHVRALELFDELCKKDNLLSEFLNEKANKEEEKEENKQNILKTLAYNQIHPLSNEMLEIQIQINEEDLYNPPINEGFISVQYLNYLIKEIEDGNLTNIVPEKQIENDPVLLDKTKKILNNLNEKLSKQTYFKYEYVKNLKYQIARDEALMKEQKLQNISDLKILSLVKTRHEILTQELNYIIKQFKSK